MSKEPRTYLPVAALNELVEELSHVELPSSTARLSDDGFAPGDGLEPSNGNPVLRDADPEPEPRRRRLRLSAKRIKELDAELSTEDWTDVYYAYQNTGVPAKLAEETDLSCEQVEYLLGYGIRRLQLPGIAEHARDKATIALAVQHETKLQDMSSPALFSGPEVQKAITSRVVQEAAAAQSVLDASMAANRILRAYIDKALLLAESGEIALPEKLTLGTLETLQKSLVANTLAMERAVKLTRLTKGEPTELLGVQVGALVATCSLEELEEAERSGSIPRRLLTRFASGDKVLESKVIDVDSDSDSDSDGEVEAEESIEGMP